MNKMSHPTGYDEYVDKVYSDDDEYVKEDSNTMIGTRMYPEIEKRNQPKEKPVNRFKKLEKGEEVSDNDLFVSCCKKMNWDSRGYYPKRRSDGCYKLNHYTCMRKKKDKLVKPCVKSISPEYFKCLYLKNLCRSRGGMMTPSEKKYAIDRFTKRADKCRFVVCNGKLYQVKHNFPCGLAAKITGVDTADIAERYPESDKLDSGTAVDGVYIPSEPSSNFSRELNDDFDIKEINDRIQSFNECNPETIGKYLQKDNENGTYAVSIKSSVYRHMLRNKQRFGLNDDQINNDSSKSRGKIYLDGNAGLKLRHDLLKRYKKSTAHNNIQFVVKPHRGDGSWKCLDREVKKVMHSKLSPYKHTHEYSTDTDKEYQLQFRVVLKIKFVE